MSKSIVVERRSLAIQVADALRKMIMDGKYVQGEQLRQEQIAADLGVSRVPVREAFQQLEAEGLITNMPYKGAMVTKLSEGEIREYFDIRASLEADLLGLAMPNLGPVNIERARKVLEKLENASPARWGSLNWDLHAAIYEAAERPLTLDMVKKLHDNMDRYVRIQMSISPQHRKHADQEHQEFIELCEAGKKREAVKFIRNHICKARDDLLAHLKEHP